MLITGLAKGEGILSERSCFLPIEITLELLSEFLMEAAWIVGVVMVN